MIGVMCARLNAKQAETLAEYKSIYEAGRWLSGALPGTGIT